MATRKPKSKKKYQTTRKRVAKPKAPVLGVGSDMPEEMPLLDAEVTLPDDFNIEYDDDGSVDVDLSEPLEASEIGEEFYENHNANLAEALPEFVLDKLASDLIMAIENDKSDRQEWSEMRAKSVELCGVQLQNQGGNVGGTTASPVPGQSKVNDPLIMESVLRGQATAYGELCPANGPVKVINYGPRTTDNESLAEALERDFNYYLTTIASEYYPDTRKMLFWTYLASGTFKKVYKCPIRRRPVSEYVDGSNLIIPGSATDVKNAGRITHEVTMRPSVMKRMMMIGAYRKVDLSEPPPPTKNAVTQKVEAVTGVQSNSSPRPEDAEHQLYECYCEIDLPNFEHKEDGEPSGLPLPYIVTMDVVSQKVLAIRRNWKEGDEDCTAKIPFVQFPYATGLSIYGVGLGQILGNMASALTALLRLSIDNGIFANFPGFLFSKAAVGRQISNEFRVPPGGGVGLDTGQMPINQAVMPLPYKEVGASMLQQIAALVDRGQKLGGVADTQIGEGKQEAPVGTTLALIEQATKIEGAVHKALHAAQSEELRLILDLLREDPDPLWRGNPRPAMGQPPQLMTQQPLALPPPPNGGMQSPSMQSPQMGAAPQGMGQNMGQMPPQMQQPQQQQSQLPLDRVERFKLALANCDLVPASDPNVPSHMDRLMKAAALVQMAIQAPETFNARQVAKRALAMMRIDDDGSESLILPPPQPQQPQPDPSVVAGLQFKEKELQFKQQKLLTDTKMKEADRKSKEDVEVLKLANSAMIHGDQAGKVKDHLEEWGAWVQPGTDTRQ